MGASPYVLAVDIGASSGRHILGFYEDGKMKLEEVYRFENNLIEKNGHLCWDLNGLFEEIKRGMKRCAELGKIPASMGIDTWGVDFVLLDKEGHALGDAVSYRDSRTEGMEELASRSVSPEALYKITGIQKMVFNTVYQLLAVKKEHPEELSKAETFLMIPDYFHYLLTGVAKNEYTNATTTGLLGAAQKTWDRGLLKALEIPEKIFGSLSLPGTPVGALTKEIADEVGFSCDVVLPGTHDTASAVLAVPKQNENAAYISSGTWSLIGVERQAPDCSEESRKLNFTNEGGYGYRFRYLKNIMGLWMIQSVRRELKAAGAPHTFDELCDLAREAEGFESVVDVSDDCFLAPGSMAGEVDAYCARTGQKAPSTIGERMCCIYQSLAVGYKKAVEELEKITGKEIPCIHIVGGGSKDGYLNELTARYTGKPVYAGPSEATAIGNLLAQMIRSGVFADVDEARKAVSDSFSVTSV